MTLHNKDNPTDEANIELANRRIHPIVEPIAASSQAEASKYIEFLLTTPGKKRKGVARSGDSLRGFVNYHLVVFRSDERRWSVYLEWVDLKGGGHRELLPHEVVNGILQRANSIIAECRRDRARRSVISRGQQLRPKRKARTRKHNK